jgi:hypothetical protein
MVALGTHAPRLYDKLAARFGYEMQQTSRPSSEPGDRRDNMDQPRADGATRGRYPYATRNTSLFTELQMQPVPIALLGMAAMGAVAAMMMPRNDNRARGERRRFADGRR